MIAPQASFLSQAHPPIFTEVFMQLTRTRGAAYEEAQRRHAAYPTPHQQVLKTLRAFGPMRVARLAAALGAGLHRMEMTCAELVQSGAIRRDDEAFYELVEA